MSESFTQMYAVIDGNMPDSSDDQDCLVGKKKIGIHSSYILVAYLIMMKGAIPSSHHTFSDIRTLFPCLKIFGNVKELAAMFLLLLLKLKNNKFLEKLQRQEF